MNRAPKIYKVFVSSTFLDLQKEREMIMKTLLEMNCMPVGMELFPAANEDQWTLIKRTIEECDYYIVIVGGRYGSIGLDGQSYTEMEYRYAEEKGVPVLGFIHQKPDQLPWSNTEQSEKGRGKLENFRKYILGRLCKSWTNPDELCKNVMSSINKEIIHSPRSGWIKGEDLVKVKKDPNEKKELSEYMVPNKWGEFKDFITRNKLNPEKVNRENGLITILPTNDIFHNARRHLLEMPNIKHVALVGASLFKAFDTINELQPEFIGNILEERLSSASDSLEKVEIYITDPMLFDKSNSEALGTNTPLNRIKTSLDFISELAKKVAPQKELLVYFIPLLQLDHLVVSDNYLIVRNTLLWTAGSVSKNELRGSWMLYDNPNKTPSMFSAYDKYLNILRENSILLSNGDQLLNERHSKLKSQALKIHHKFREAIQKVGNNKLQVRKVYRNQLLSFISSTWHGELRTSNKDLTWKNENEVFFTSGKSQSDFRSLSLEKLEPFKKHLKLYIESTEKILNDVVKYYDHKEGFAQVVPVNEFSLPASETSYKGGFSSGCIVLWKCGTPIIPIDAITSVCTTSYSEISRDVMHGFQEDEFKEILLKAHLYGYLANFKDRNHFFMIAKSKEEERYYIVIHSSSSQYDNHVHGLYPNENSWYYHNIKERIYDNGRRRLRYIKDSDAHQFYSITKSVENHNVETHKWLVEQVTGSANDANRMKSYHHSYMPNSQCVAKGVYVESDNVVVPILTAYGKNIPLLKVKKNGGILLNQEERVVLSSSLGFTFQDSFESFNQQLDANNYSELIMPGNGIAADSFCKPDTGLVVDELEPFITYQSGNFYYHKN